MIFSGQRQYIIGLGGIHYQCMGNAVEVVKGPREVAGAAWFVADPAGSVPQLATVETEAQYAEVLLRKRLRESGEFDEQIHLLSHWKKARGKNLTSGFFTALPLKQFTIYTEQCKAAPDSILFFPLHGTLYRILMRQNPVTPQALVFRHGRFADIIVATLRDVHAVFRLTAFDLSEEQVHNLWATVAEELRNVQSTNQLNIEAVHYLNWIDAEEEPPWGGEPACRVIPMQRGNYKVEGEDKACSFIPALAALSPRDSASPPAEIAIEYCRNWVAPLSLLFVLLGLACFGGKSWLGREMALVEQKVASLRLTLDTFVTGAEPLEDVVYQDSLSFVRDVDIAGKARHFPEIMEELTVAAFRGVMLADLEVEYSPREVRVWATGTVRAGFEAAMNGYQDMLRKLRRQGYEIVEDRFDTNLSEARFQLALRRTYDDG